MNKNDKNNPKRQPKNRFAQKKDENILTTLYKHIIETEKIKYFKDSFDQLCATITESQKTFSCLVESIDFADYIRRVADVEFDSFVLDSQIASISTRLMASLKNNQTLPTHTVYKRIGVSKKGFYYYNLDGVNFVCYKSASKTKITTSSQAKFFTSDKQLKQVLPDLTAEYFELFDLLDKHFNFSNDDDLMVFIAWLLYCFIPDSSVRELDHPALILVGMQGSGKSTALAKISKIVSPSVNIFESINSRESLLLNLSNNYISTFDNVRTISNDLQDLLCKGVTGGTETIRTLFTTNKTTTISYKTILVLNGICTSMATNSDFLDRCITLKLDKITQKKDVTKDEIMKAFEADLPKILGCIFNILPEILKSYPNVELENSPRFKDFAQFGTAVTDILFDDWQFMESYNKVLYSTQRIAIDEDIVLETLERFINTKNFKGTSSNLITELSEFASESGVTLPSLQANKLSEKINHAEGSLKKLGIEIQHKRSNGQRIILITKNKHKEGIYE